MHVRPSRKSECCIAPCVHCACWDRRLLPPGAPSCQSTAERIGRSSACGGAKLPPHGGRGQGILRVRRGCPRPRASRRRRRRGARTMEPHGLTSLAMPPKRLQGFLAYGRAPRRAGGALGRPPSGGPRPGPRAVRTWGQVPSHMLFRQERPGLCASPMRTGPWSY